MAAGEGTAKSASVEERLRALGRARTRIGLLLTAAVVAIYFGFIGAVAFAKPLLGRQIVPGLSVGILFGAAVIVSAWSLTWVYVRWATFTTTPRSALSESSRCPRRFYATALIGAFYLMTFILGFGAMVLVGPEVIRAADAGGNMAAPLLAELLGGKAFLGFIAAVAFATILAVVAGLTLSGAAALSHDLWVNVVRGGRAEPREELVVARFATLVLGLAAVGLGVAFKGQNVAFMVSLAFAIAASANFPALVLSIFWARCTTAGAVASMVTGTVSALLLIFLSPTVQVDLLGAAEAWFPLRNPALVTVPLSFTVALVVSFRAPERGADARYAAVARRMHLGEK